MRSLLCGALVALSAASTGCGFHLEQLEPKPNVAMPSQPPQFVMELGPGVPDAFEVVSDTSIDGDVQAWHASLQRGFYNAFPNGRNGVARLRLEHTEWSLVPAAVTAGGAVVAVRAQLRFRGRWLLGNGEIPVAGVAESKKTTTSKREIDDLAESSIETMFEHLGYALFQTVASQPPPPPPPPASPPPPPQPAPQPPAEPVGS
jgi:hypothetical protein